MRSRASLKAHPLHPALVPFPFAFLFGSVVFDVLGMFEQQRSLWMTGSHLVVAGVGAGLLAAIPGAIDYLKSVPPRSSGKARATRHAVGNVAALTLFTFAWLLRAPDSTPTPLSMTFAVVGALVLAYSGWLGGTLVIRNMIGVDHRYADAGKWQEATFSASPGQPLVVGAASDLKEDQMKLLHVNGRRIVLARTAQGFTAFDDACTHHGGSLAGGVLIGGTVQCLWHGSQFDSASGKVECGPAKRGVRVYEVTQARDGKLTLVVPQK